MRSRITILIILTAGLLVLIAVWYVASSLFKEDFVKILIATDKLEYQVGETVHIDITNYEDHTVEIYCPLNCALGNFPTTVERYNNGDWEYFAGFCPSIEPLFGDYKSEGGYIIHPLAPGDSFDLEISNFEALHLQKAEQLRILYYLDAGGSAILSDDFLMKP